jgi:hypothetical protein
MDRARCLPRHRAPYRQRQSSADAPSGLISSRDWGVVASKIGDLGRHAGASAASDPWHPAACVRVFRVAPAIATSGRAPQIVSSMAATVHGFFSSAVILPLGSVNRWS